jgi:hypothetical protein
LANAIIGYLPRNKFVLLAWKWIVCLKNQQSQIFRNKTIDDLFRFLQNDVITAGVARGDGPPGTGKSLVIFGVFFETS